MSKLGIDPILVITQVVNFFLLLFVLKRFLYKPVLAVLEKRKETVQKIEQSKKEIDELKSQIESEKDMVLSETRQESEKILGNARSQGEKIKQKNEIEAQKQAKEILDRAQRDIESQEKALKHELSQQVGKVAVQVAEDVLRMSITSEQKEQLLKQSIERFVKV